MAGGGAVAAVARGGAVAPTGGPAVWRGSDGGVGIDASRLTPLYYGERVSPQQVLDLNEHGKAMAGVQNVEAACHGVTLYFDTGAEADAYGADFTSRLRAMRAREKADGTFVDHPPADPCAEWTAPLPTFHRNAG